MLLRYVANNRVCVTGVNRMDLQKILNEEVKTLSEITEGFSRDKKYLVNEKYIVRVIEKDRIPRFKFVLEVQKKFQEVALCQRVIDLIEDDEKGYYITEYIPGKNGLEVIELFSLEKQRELGVIAAKEIVKFHKKYPAKDFDVKKYLLDYMNEKIERAISDNVDAEIPEIHDIIDVVRNNIHHLFQLEGVLTHSDYHLFNMIFDHGEYKGVIDFERARVAIFLTDFRNNTPHNSYKSPHFASGFIDGYLDEIPVDNFFLMYNVHDLLLTIAALPWVKIYDPENIEKNVKLIRDIYSNAKNLDQAPAWYVGKY